MTKKIENPTLDIISVSTQYKYDEAVVSSHTIAKNLNKTSFIGIIKENTKNGGDYNIKFSVNKIKIEISQYVFLSHVEIKIITKTNNKTFKYEKRHKSLQNPENLSNLINNQIIESKFL